MVKIILLHFLSIILVAQTPTHLLASASPCLSGGTPVPLTYAGKKGIIMPGFYNPNYIASNASTWPVACNPTVACALTRAMGGTCDELQGEFEPLECERGHYCNSTTMIVCPSGHFCRDGATAPTPCPPLSDCPAGSERARYYAPFILLAIVLTIVFLAIIYYHKWRPLPAPCTFPAAKMSKDERRRVLQRGVKRARIETGLGHALRVEFEDMCVSLVGDESSATPTREERVLVKGVSGRAMPGQVLALLGPSGAGKSLSISALMHNLDPSKFRVTGRRAFNGVDDATSDGGFDQLRSATQAVPQDDVLHEELSVLQNVYYASELQLPRNWTDDEREEYRDVVLSLLGLSEHMHTVVSSISGGQRKRCAIAAALACAPALITLDEPTSGLDATTSLELFHTLKQLAVAGRLTVIAVVHQPREEVWSVLDQVLLIAPGGRTVYSGPACDAVEALGEWVTVGPRENPADCLADAISTHGEEMADRWKSKAQEKKSSDDFASPESSLVVAAEEEQQQKHVSSPPAAAAAAAATTQRNASFLHQTFIFHSRALCKTLAGATFLLLEWVILILLGLIMSQAADEVRPRAVFAGDYKRISPQFILTFWPLFSCYAVMSFGLSAAVAGVRTYGGEEKIRFTRECGGGSATMKLAYFLGVSICSLYRVFVSSTLFTTLVFQFDTDFFRIYLPNYFLCYASVSALGYSVSLVVKAEYANVLAASASVLFGLMNGFVEFPVNFCRFSYAFWNSQMTFVSRHHHIVHGTPNYGDWGYDENVTVGETYAVLVSMVLILHLTTLILLMV